MFPRARRTNQIEPDGIVPVPMIVGQNVGKRFGSEWITRGFDIHIQGATIFGLFGPSGSGKTTLLRLFLGLLRPDEGEIRVFGTAPHRLTARMRTRLGYMPQQFALYPEFTAYENLDLVASWSGLPWWGRRVRLRTLLELVELWDARNKVSSQLSGGMQRRLQLVAALVSNPDLLVVDEPTAGLDPILRGRIWDYFRRLRSDGRTLLVTSQYLNEAEHCDEIAVLRGGTIVSSGRPDDVRRRVTDGDLVTIFAPNLDRRVVDIVRGLEGVRAVRWTSENELRATVEAAGTAIPEIFNALQAAGIAFPSVREDRLSFDDVFVQAVGGATPPGT